VVFWEAFFFFYVPFASLSRQEGRVYPVFPSSRGVEEEADLFWLVGMVWWGFVVGGFVLSRDGELSNDFPFVFSFPRLTATSFLRFFFEPGPELRLHRTTLMFSINSPAGELPQILRNYRYGVSTPYPLGRCFFFLSVYDLDGSINSKSLVKFCFVYFFVKRN